MNDANRLNVVVDVFEAREQEWMRRLGEYEAQFRKANRQLQELQDYRAGYLTGMKSPAATNPRRLQELNAFVARLGDAIRQQQAVITRAARDRDEIRRRWLASRQRTQAVSKLRDRRQHDAIQVAERLEQKEQDDRNTRSLRAPGAGRDVT